MKDLPRSVANWSGVFLSTFSAFIFAPSSTRSRTIFSLPEKVTKATPVKKKNISDDVRMIHPT